MRSAAEMVVKAVVVGRDMPVRELAELLHQEDVDGACVMDGDELVGVVTTMDLIHRETSLHMPTTFVLLDAVIALPGEWKRAERELDKIASVDVGALMSSKLVTVGPKATLQQCADHMVRKHLTILPVVEAGQLLGVVTKDAMLRATGMVSDDE